MNFHIFTISSEDYHIPLRICYNGINNLQEVFQLSTHINAAEPGEIAESVLMPGDPLRAKYIAENYLEGPVLYSDVRNMKE